MSTDNIEMGSGFKDKKVLVFGLGLLGGGVATTNWLLKQGARVTVTDPLGEDRLAESIKKLEGNVEFRLNNSQTEEDYKKADVVIINPAFPPNNEWTQLAKKLGKEVTNEAIIFYNLFPGKIIGVTGTRGKTTTTTWIHHFLQTSFRSTLAGNSSERPFLKVLDESSQFDIAATETPSYHLEYFNSSVRSADIAVVTNIYIDHINFHGTREKYAEAKMNIFRWQKPGQRVVLNYDNDLTENIIQNPSPSDLWLFSATQKLPEDVNGIFYTNHNLIFQRDGRTETLFSIGNFVKEKGEHNLENLLASASAAHLAGVPWEKIQSAISTLPQIPFRQEIIFKNDELTIINDTTATSPDGAIAAVKRFSGPHTILIAGGTDRDLDFTEWGKVIPRHIKLENIILLSGSATDKMQASLKGGPFGKSKVASPHQTLADCLAAALAQTQAYGHWVVLFSPGAKSFEKFSNEFDRGERFNALVKKVMGR